MKKHIFLGAAILLLMAACSHDENNNGGTEPLQKVQFSFTNEDFGADEALTRATSAAEKPQTIDLGDCEAEISVESEPAVKTRGPLTNANGHYTIRAYQGGTLKGEMKGTFSGGAFTADVTSVKNLDLDPGTYDFIAFNDDVIPSGTELTVARDKAETARMGFATQVITATPNKQEVSFTMKHVGCRLRTQIVTQKHISETITATLEQTAANVIPTSVAYNPATKAYTNSNGAMTPEANNSPASTEAKYHNSGYGVPAHFFYTSTSDYHYFLPTTNGTKLKVIFSGGTVFWDPLSGTIPQLSAALTMDANKSYLVKIKLKPNYLYLFSDGTTGFFKETTAGGGSKTPVAIVVERTKHIAMALQDIPDPFIPTGVARFNWDNKLTLSSVDMPTSDSEAFTRYNGYEETWDGSTTLDGKIKGNEAVYPAFKATNDYANQVSVSGTLAGKKWYLPALGEWKYAISTLGFGDTDGVTAFNTGVGYYPNLVDEAVKKVGGGRFTYRDYWSSTELGVNRAAYIQTMFGSTSMTFRTFTKTYVGGAEEVRPFIKY